MKHYLWFLAKAWKTSLEEDLTPKLLETAGHLLSLLAVAEYEHEH